MAEQEFLASYGVQIDEGGVNRLHRVLEENKSLAEKVSGAFSGADSSVQAFFRRAAENTTSADMDSALARIAKQYYGLSRLNRSGAASEPGSGYRAEGVRGEVQDLFSGALTESPDSGLMNYILRGQEITWAGMASGDTKNYVKGNSAGRPTLADFGIDGDEPDWLKDYREKANDIMRKPLQEVRKITKEAAEAEARGEDTRPYIDRIKEIMRDPLEKVRELYQDINLENLGETGTNWEEQLADIDQKWTDLVKKMGQPITIDLNTSAAESAARSAAEAIRSILTQPIFLNVQTPQSPGNSGGPGSTFLRMSSGGRFTKPTEVQVAEDGGTEYIIPVGREERAIPLLRQLLGELSPGARESLTGGGVAALGGGLAAGSVSSAGITQNNQTVSAPVSINIHANGSDARQIGETIYDTAERYLLRTMKGAFS